MPTIPSSKSSETDDSSSSPPAQKKPDTTTITNNGKITIDAVRLRNKEHARKSRARKRQWEEDIKELATTLKQENAKLRAGIEAALGKESAHSLIQAQLPRPTDEQFCQDLRVPENRIVTTQVADFLKTITSKGRRMAAKRAKLAANKKE